MSQRGNRHRQLSFIGDDYEIKRRNLLDILRRMGPESIAQRKKKTSGEYVDNLPFQSFRRDSTQFTSTDDEESDHYLDDNYDSLKHTTSKKNSRLRKRNRDGAKQTLKKLRRIVKVFCALYRLWKSQAMGVESVLNKYDSLNIIDAKEEEEESIKSEEGLFDASIFKPHKNSNISSEARRILQLKQDERSEHDRHYIKVLMRNYKSLCEYPISMQSEIARRAWYESYNAKRIVLREGHPAQSFYIILSGSVLVTVYDRKDDVNKTVCFLNRGDSFGELGIINRAKRSTTIVSKETVEFLCLSSQDFMDIFMAGGDLKLNDSFLSNIKYLHGWPLEILQFNPKKVVSSFFKRGTVVVKDTRDCEWLYFIKSGSCIVLKRLGDKKNKEGLLSKTSISRSLLSNRRQTEHKQNLERQMEEKESFSTVRKKLEPLPEIRIAVQSSYHRAFRRHRKLEKRMSLLESQQEEQSLMEKNVVKIFPNGPVLTRSSLRAVALGAKESDEESDNEYSDENEDEIEIATCHSPTEQYQGLNWQFVNVQTLTKGSVFVSVCHIINLNKSESFI
ncbi:DgyrCDS4238 [Dimorphilus gyrociliatus]|uniref:DgyrCDS4238 n=1 Tax=Dimorphilus gyrociliatus TaxID=2664684 RepID=A0A7I8VGC9_9ANNE|nr:DgyrCDS4238 [Dimorphilus gyrociliatus]